MNISTLLGRLLAAARGRHAVSVQYLGWSDEDLRALRPVIEGVGERLGLRLQLQHGGGDIVVVESTFASHVSPQALLAYCEERPLVQIDAPPAEGDTVDQALERFERCQQALLSQLREIPLVQRSSPRWRDDHWLAEPAGADSGFDPGFDSGVDAGQLTAQALDEQRQRIVSRLLHGFAEPGLPALSAGYGPGAWMTIDFAAGSVLLDPLAEQKLRAQRELPLLSQGGAPGEGACVRPLDLTVWDFGQASADSRLLDEPADWWHAPLAALDLEGMERFTRQPRDLELARRLSAAPATPSELRRHARVGIAELRRFVQAGLFLRRIRWASWLRRP